MKKTLRKILVSVGLGPEKVVRAISKWSISQSISQNHYNELVNKLRLIAPDISHQESRESLIFDDYIELKRRGLQAFQCDLMLHALKSFSEPEVSVVDIGDSAGTHMLYLKNLIPNGIRVDTVSVNLDKRAIEKIKARGMTAIHCRAEDLDLGDKEFDLFTSFQMVEHLHNPAIFFRRMAKKAKGRRMLVTVPYQKFSRVGLSHIRDKLEYDVFAEDEHVFELNPEDWKLLMLHSGWRIISSRIFYQYPRNWMLFSWVLSFLWRKIDYEGFWGVLLEKDTTFSDRYKDWEN